MRFPNLRLLLVKFYPIIFLVIIVALAIDLLNVSNLITAPILAQREKEFIISTLKEAFPQDYRIIEIQGEFVILTLNNQIVGRAFVADGYGYGGRIRILSVLNEQSNIELIRILRQTETPGLGGLIEHPKFTSQFSNIKIESVLLADEGGQIDGITGATITSAAVVDMIRKQGLERISKIPTSSLLEMIELDIPE